MVWLIILILTLQAFFYWLIKPIIILSTPLIELRGLNVVLLLFIAWIFSAMNNDKKN